MHRKKSVSATSITLKQLKVLSALAQQGSLTKATKILQNSQPSISHHLAKLEEAVGVSLWSRGKDMAQLTSAGEFWYEVSEKINLILEDAENEFQDRYGSKMLEVRFGMSPNLKGPFSDQVAKICSTNSKFRNVCNVFDNDIALSKLLIVRTINSAFVLKDSSFSIQSEFDTTHLFVDRILWAVPSTIPKERVVSILKGSQLFSPHDIIFNRYVKLENNLKSFVNPIQNISRRWFSEIFPKSQPFFYCNDTLEALDLVAGNLATCHCYMSCLPYVKSRYREKINFFVIDASTFEVEFVVPRHLLTLNPFRELKTAIVQKTKDMFSETEEEFFDMGKIVRV